MAKAIMVQGTNSNAGKSLITAALCRILKQDGFKTAPFKSQNMALNSYITKDGYEMGRAQVMQAEAAGIEPDVRMNPILLKPTGEKGCQIVLNGKVFRDMTAGEYYEYKKEMVPHILSAYNSLSKEYDIIVIEGAGSPAEINLREQDIVNMGMAEMADAPVIIVGDIDRGGVFASLAGTMLLFNEAEKARVKGFVINKFRGDVNLLTPGLDMLRDITNVNTLGVVPYLKVDIDDEDSLSERLENSVQQNLIDIAVIRLPRLSNFTDFNVFSLIKGVSVRYVTSVKDLGEPDMIIIPGTKSTIDDLKWIRQSGLEIKIKKHANDGKAVFGICGGYQMLGEEINDPDNVEGGGSIQGLGLLKTKTTFFKEKTTVQASGKINKLTGFYEMLSGTEIKGYEIHMGDSVIIDGIPMNTVNGKIDGCVQGNVAGSYIHGFFDNSEVANNIIKILAEQKGVIMNELEEFDIIKYKESQYDILAECVRKSIDMDKIYDIIGNNH
ncbi:MAG: cobyric acid synthase [Sedimentibacter sp.]